MEEGERAGPDTGATRPRARRTLFRPTPSTASRDGIPICPYLAREGIDQTLGPALTTVDPAHRCVALAEPVPQSARQQELVCLTAAHLNCPRYLRATQLAEAPPVTPAREPVSAAVIAAALVLVAAIAASFGFLAVKGGFDLSIATPAPSQVALLPSPTAGRSPAAGSGSSPAPVASPTSGASPSSNPARSPRPTASARTTPRPSPTRTPAPSSNRFALLTACPATRDCWIYVIRSGDNLVSIANYFGVDYDRMRAMNPNLRVPIHAGDPLRMPTPTR